MAFSRYKSQFMPVAGFVFSIIGLIYSIIMTFGLGSEALCLTSGCTIVQDFKVFGISPWWISCLMFAAIAALCFFRMRLFAKFLASLFLAGDCVFLLVMFFVAPCTSCLGIAVIIFAVWAALRIERARLVTARRIMAGAISGVWLVLFILNLGYAINEMLPGWEINEAGGEDKKISVYFSPSCSACREAIKIFEDRAVFYPVAENDEDYWVIADIAQRVDAGLSVHGALAIIRYEQEAGLYLKPEISLGRRMINSIKIMRNQASMLRQGHSVLPVIMFEGLPASWAGSGGSDASGTNQDLGPSQEPYPASLGQSQRPAQDNGAVRLGENSTDDESLPYNADDRQTGATGESSANLGGDSEAAPSFDLPLDFGDTLECERGAEIPCDE